MQIIFLFGPENREGQLKKTLNEYYYVQRNKLANCPATFVSFFGFVKKHKYKNLTEPNESLN